METGRGALLRTQDASRAAHSSIFGKALHDCGARQRRAAFIVCALAVLVTVALLPFADATVGTLPGFLPIYQAGVILCCLITAYLIFWHFRATGAVVLLHLSAGYLYTAAVLLMQLLTFRGLFVDNVRLLGGPQSTVWLWFCWHLGPALSVMWVAASEYHHPDARVTDEAGAVRLTAIALALAVTATALVAFGLADRLPVLDIDGDYSRIVTSGIAPVLQLLLGLALVFLWKASQFRNGLHLWLGIVVVALLCDNALTMAGGNRAALGWYAGRMGALVGFLVLMLVYLHEIKASYLQSAATVDLLASTNSQLDLLVQERTVHGERLARADQRKDELLVILAHELRNPLAPISTAAHLLSIGYADQELVRKTSALLTRQVEQMSGLVEDLLDVSRLSHGQLPINRIRIDARQLVNGAVEQAQPLITEKGHDLQVWQPDTELIVFADRSRMVQVLTNVLNNAAKYTPPGGRIEVRLELQDDLVLFIVKDNGAGMTPDMIERAFELFTQAELTPGRLHGGLGIGLALVKSLVELHGGHVRAASPGLGQGSEFRVALRRAPGS